EEFGRAKARVLGSPAAPAAGCAANALNSLSRSQDDRWIGGVCGGIARATGVASWVWRLLFLLGVCFAGSGLVLYLLLWLLLPPAPLGLPAPGERPTAS
ncbi:MAG TPA: PspC domain-containing protein, partial [Burkholderiaceae bacterium]